MEDIDDRRNEYCLTDFQYTIVVEFGNDLHKSLHPVLYSKMLLQIGMYQQAVTELQTNGYFVEAQHLAIALNELGLLCTRQDIFKSLRKSGNLDNERDKLTDIF